MRQLWESRHEDAIPVGAAEGCDLLIFYQALTGSVLLTGSAFDAGRYRIQ
jgi:hypothetical protein